MTDYRMSHRPDADTDDEKAVRFHELDKAMPDFYERAKDYVWDLGEPEHMSLQFRGHHQAIRQAQAARGNPNARVFIYRAVPKGIRDINTGDWVTTSHQYAYQHGMHPEDPSKDMDVIAKSVKAQDVSFGGNDAFEFGYVGEPKKGTPVRIPKRKR